MNDFKRWLELSKKYRLSYSEDVEFQSLSRSMPEKVKALVDKLKQLIAEANEKDFLITSSDIEDALTIVGLEGL